MCGRFSLTLSDLAALADRFGFQFSNFNWNPRYNIAPTQNALTVVNVEGNRLLKQMQWGLIPHWSKDKKVGYSMINARAESISTKPTFRHLYKSKRCLILADGFYEWKKSKTKKIPYRITLKNNHVFAFAGLWDTWKDLNGKELNTFTIITTEANDLLKTLHDRMPVILKKNAELEWLDPKTDNPKKLLQPYPFEQMDFYEVSPVVNSWKNDSPQCIEKK